MNILADRITDQRSRRIPECAVYPSHRGCVEDAPPTLLGGVNGKNISKMDAGERKSSICIDWLQGTFPYSKMTALFDYLNEMCGGEAEIYDHGLVGYQESCEWHPFGIKVCWDRDKKNRINHAGRAFFQIGGSGLSSFPPESIYKFLRDLSIRFFFKASRIDLAFDDYERIIEPEEVNEFSNDGSYKGFRKHKYIGGSTRSGEATDAGIYFGTRGKNGGGKFLRCYDKQLESKGETKSIRWEVEFSKDRANNIYFELAMASNLESFVTKIALFIGGSIDFIEGGSRSKIDRLAFWEQILHHLGSASLRSPVADGSIEKSIGWVSKSVTPSLVKIRKAIGDDEFNEWLQDQMQDVVLKIKAERQVQVYHTNFGEPLEEAPF